MAEGQVVGHTAITNPTSTSGDAFGIAVAAVGSDKVVIGAFGYSSAIGRAYLFSTDGALLTTFTNPAPSAGDHFGISVAALGSDRVIIGADGQEAQLATDAGAVYLFSTNGALLTTIANPTPTGAGAEGFGLSVASVEPDKLLVGAFQAYRGPTRPGEAYLFDTNGTLLVTITNPTPVITDNFGLAVAGVGRGLALVTANQDDTGTPNAGAAYLYDANGTLSLTITNPLNTANDNFGDSATAVGSDKFAIAAMQANLGAPNAGAAFLFSTNGQLLATFANPTPNGGDLMGISIACVGSEKVVVGSWYDSEGGNLAGAAHLFHTNGTWLASYINPAPSEGGEFGRTVTGVGADKIVISTHKYRSFTGIAYVFEVKPSLRIIATTTNTVVVSWPSGWTDWTLAQTTNGITSSWTAPGEAVLDNGTNKWITVESPSATQFYRLVRAVN